MVSFNFWETSSAYIVPYITGHKGKISKLAFRIPCYYKYVLNLCLLVRGDASTLSSSVPSVSLSQLFRVDQMIAFTEQVRHSYSLASNTKTCGDLF